MNIKIQHTEITGYLFDNARDADLVLRLEKKKMDNKYPPVLSIWLRSTQ
jgi:hypothetical protein